MRGDQSVDAKEDHQIASAKQEQVRQNPQPSRNQQSD
jgi:hypothetical protein